MKKIGIIYFCTGEYSIFWDDFYCSAEKYLLRKLQKHYFIFTDSTKLLNLKNNERIHTEQIDHKKWPYITLLRYDIIMKHKAMFNNMDYLYFMNSNLLLINYVDEGDFLPKDNELVVVELRSRKQLNLDGYYEKSIRSTAYIPEGKGEIYVAGGLNGGKTNTYLKMAEICDAGIKQDIDNHIMAAWHDESHLNRYIVDYPNIKRLNKDIYCIDEDARKDETKIIIRNKNKYNFKGQKGFRTTNDFSEIRFRENIVVYGTGKIAEKWYQRNKDKVTIKCFICTDPKEAYFHGIEVKKACPESVKGSFVILALANGYSYAYALMQECGYEEYKDFLKASEYDVV